MWSELKANLLLIVVQSTCLPATFSTPGVLFQARVRPTSLPSRTDKALISLLNGDIVDNRGSWIKI